GRDVLVDLHDESEPLRLVGHTDVVNSLAFSPDGLHLVSASHDRTAIVWEIPSGKRLKTLTGHEDHVVAVAFSCDGKRIATGGKDAKIIVWQSDTFDEEIRISGHI